MNSKHYIFRYRITKNGYSLLRRGRVVLHARSHDDMHNFCIGFCEAENARYTLRATA